MVLDEARDAVRKEFPREQQHERAPQHLRREEQPRRGLLHNLHRRQPREREQCLAPIGREPLGRHDRRLALLFDRTDGERLELPHRQLSDIPDAHAPLLDEHGTHRTAAADMRRERRAPLARQRRLQQEIISSIHHMVRHPLIKETAHQSICAPDGAIFVMTILRTPRSRNSKNAAELTSSQPPV